MVMLAAAHHDGCERAGTCLPVLARSGSAAYIGTQRTMVVTSRSWFADQPQADDV